MRLLDELRRRNVIRVAGLYLVGAWLVTQVASTVLPMFGAPEWLPRSVVILLAVGFVPMLVVSWVFEWTPGGIKRDADLTPGESVAPRTARRLDRTIMIVLALALGYFAFDKFVLAPRRDAALVARAEQAATAKAAARRGADDRSIAVLPLANDSGDKEQQYFSDGLSQDLITALSQFAGLRVIGRNSAFQFRDSNDDIRTIGAKLGVAYLIEGSVRRGGDVVRISAELVSTADGSTLWSQRYDRPYKDLFALQDEIVQAVAGTLKSRLLAGEGGVAQSERPPSGNLDAYNAYLQGWFYYSRRTEPDLRKAIAAFANATRLDPAYAFAHATVSRTWVTLASGFLSGDEAAAGYEQGRKEADVALALDPDLAVAHIARAYVLQLVDFDWHGAEAELVRASQLAPDDGTSKFALGLVRASLGQLEPAVALISDALVIDPLHASWYQTRSGVLGALGRLDEAEASIRKAIDLQPGAARYHGQLMIVFLLRGDAAGGLATAKQEPPGMWRDVATALALQIGPDRAAADAALAALIEQHAAALAYQIAQAYALRGDADQAFAWLERAANNRDPGIAALLYDALLLRFKADARFGAFCRKVGLPTSQDRAAPAPSREAASAKGVPAPAGKP